MKKFLISLRTLDRVIRGKSRKSTPVGKAVDHHDNWFVMWVSTDQETEDLRYSDDGMLILNVRKQIDKDAPKPANPGAVTKLLVNLVALDAVVRGADKKSTPIAKYVDAHGNWFVVFVSTDEHTDELRYSADNMLITNVRKQRPRPEAETAKPADSAKMFNLP